MGMRLTFILFLSAHLLGSFYFPLMVRDGGVGGYVSSLVFYVLAVFLLFAPTLDNILFFYALTLILFHIIVDLSFSFLRRRFVNSLQKAVFFFSEEAIHLLFFAVLSYIYSARWTSPTPWRSVRSFLNQASLDYSQVLSFIALLLLLFAVSSRIISFIIITRDESKRPFTSFAMCLERCLYATALYLNSPLAFAIIFASRMAVTAPALIKNGEKTYQVLLEGVLSALLAFSSYTLVSPFIHY